MLIAGSVICLSLIVLIALPKPAAAQVSINAGAQVLYDDNVFLEDDKRRPAFLVFDDLIEEDVKRNELRTVLTEENDGKTNDDIITNLTLSLASAVPLFPEYAEMNAQGTVGFLIFADNDSENRLTLDGIFETKLAKTLLPDPYYVEVINEFASSSTDATVASGTASRSSQTYRLVGRTGVRGIQLAPRTNWGLGYTGSYNVFLGEFRFEDEAPGEIEEQGADYHSHFVATDVNYEAAPGLTLTLSGNIGVQLFTNSETNDADKILREDEDLDRTEAGGRFRVRYELAERTTASAYVGIEGSKRHEKPVARLVTAFDKENRPRQVLLERDDSEASLVFGADISQTFGPGTEILIGIDQDVGTDIDGDRLTTRTVYANGALAVDDRLTLTLGGSFNEFSNSDKLDEATERLEASLSLAYLVTQQATLTMGYNYANQDSSDDGEQLSLFSRSEDYEVSRVFVGFNIGFLGLPY